jgi:hypothetical protein
MDPTIASLGIGVGSSILGAAFGFGQASQQRAETAEQVRRFLLLKRRTESETEALGNASGITSDSGSLTKYLSDMNAEFTKQASWMYQAGANKANATEISSLFGGMKDFGSSMFQYGSANNWFRKPTIT